MKRSSFFLQLLLTTRVWFTSTVQPEHLQRWDSGGRRWRC